MEELWEEKGVIMQQQKTEVARSCYPVILCICRAMEKSTFGWDKGRAVCPALPNMLALRQWMAEENIAEPQQPHAIQIEVYLQ